MKTLGVGRRDQRGFTLVELLVTLAILGLVMAGLLTVYMTGDTIGSTGENKAEAQQAARAAMLIEEDLRLAGYGFPPVPPPQARFTAATPTAVVFWADLANASTTLTANVNAGNATLNVVSGGGITAADTVYLINGGQFAQHTVTAAVATTITVNPAVACPAGAICPPAYPQGAQVGRPRLITYSWSAATRTLCKDGGSGAAAMPPCNPGQPLATGIQNLQFTYFDASDAVIANPGANLGSIRRIQITVTAQSAATRNRGTFTMTSSVRPRNL